MVDKASNEDMIEELRRAEKKVNGTMSSADYDEVGNMGRSYIMRRFGSWNKAKKAAGLPYNKWPQLKGRGYEYSRKLRHKFSCQRCGYEHDAALTYHHKNPEEKVRSPLDDVSMDKVIAELEKCIILCSNCHKLHHSGLSDVSVDDIEIPDWPSPDKVLDNEK